MSDQQTLETRSYTEPEAYSPRPFRPAWWLPVAHLQTLAGRFLRPRRSAIRLTRERIETPDGDFLDLDWVAAEEVMTARRVAEGLAPEAGRSLPSSSGADERLVLVLHGLEGSARRGYALLLYQALAARGIRAVGLNFRSCGGEPNRLARFYHSGETDDARFVLDLLRERHPTVTLGAVGFSLGGNILLKLLGEEGADGPRRVRAAVAVSVPFDLSAGAAHLERGFGRVYARYFVRSLRRKFLAKEHLAAASCDAARARRARTFREFDDAVTAPLHGFLDADEYYRLSSSRAFLSRIRVPTLILHSMDDSFLPREAVPVQAIRENPWLLDGLTDGGGHLGFLEGGAPWAPRFWVEGEAARFLAARL